MKNKEKKRALRCPQENMCRWSAEKQDCAKGKACACGPVKEARGREFLFKKTDKMSRVRR